MQIASIIAKVFISKYNKHLEVLETWKTNREALKRNIPFHYLFDILRSFWAGTGDQKALDLSSPNNDTYLTAISKERWESILQEVWEVEKSKNERKRVNINQNSLLFLKYIYSHIVSVHQDISIDFDTEHIVPINRLKSIAERGGDDFGLPISALPNLCLIDSVSNVSKKDKTFYEYFDSLLNKGELSRVEFDLKIRGIEKMAFTRREDLAFLTGLDVNNIEPYFGYLQERFKRLKDKFFELNNIV